MPTILELESISYPAEDSVIVVTDTASSKKITVSDLRNTMVRTASTTVAGAVKVGAGLAIDPSGTLSVTNYSGYTLPKATNSRLGGVIIGSGLSVDSNGVVSAVVQNVPVASANNFGIIKVGTGLTVTDGVLNNAITQYVLPAATESTLGGIKLGYGFEVDDSVVSVKAKSYAVEGGQTISEDFDTGSASILYSVAPLTIDRNVTVTVGAGTTWVLYTPAIPRDPVPVPVPVETSGTFTQNYTFAEGKHSYSISPVEVDRNVTITVGRDSTWVVYTPGLAGQPAVNLATPPAIQESSQTITSDYTITEGTTARSFGDITIDRNVKVTVSALSTWIIF